MTSSSSDRTRQAAEALIAARRSGRKLDRLPASCAPQTEAEAWAIQEEVAGRLGEKIGGWKVGMAPGISPTVAPIFASDIHGSPARLDLRREPNVIVEAEIAFRLAQDLPARPGGKLYERDEVIAAVADVFPAIEIVVSRFSSLKSAPKLDMLSDNQSNGAFVFGKSVPGWRKFDFLTIPVLLEIAGKSVVEKAGGNPAGDPVQPLVWLANHLAMQRGGLKAGQIVTTGSYTGMNPAKPGDRVVARFTDFGEAVAEFAS